MKKLLFGISIIIFSIVISACSNAGSNKGTVIRISPEKALERLESDDNIVLLDVRTQEEYDQEHIPGSILIPVDVIEDEASVQLEDKAAEIFVYCRSGRRSAIAADALVEMGYKNVYDLGGIIDWPYETESGS